MLWAFRGRKQRAAFQRGTALAEQHARQLNPFRSTNARTPFDQLCRNCRQGSLRGCSLRSASPLLPPGPWLPSCTPDHPEYGSISRCFTRCWARRACGTRTKCAISAREQKRIFRTPMTAELSANQSGALSTSPTESAICAGACPGSIESETPSRRRRTSRDPSCYVNPGRETPVQILNWRHLKMRPCGGHCSSTNRT